MNIPCNTMATIAAFMALGFGQSYDLVDQLGIGQDGVMGEVVKFAVLLDKWATEDSNFFPGVLDYEVAEPFGEWYCAYVRVKKELPPDEVAMRELRTMFDDFMAQGAAHAT